MEDESIFALQDLLNYKEKDGMATICIIGTGYVGLVTGTCLADMGHTVTCVDIAEEKIEQLQHGIVPIHEPGLSELVRHNLYARRLNFTASYSEGLQHSDFIFIAVNTPTAVNLDRADMRYVERAIHSIARELDHDAIIVNKSTMPVGSGDAVTGFMHDWLVHPHASFRVVSNPEFLREGSAVQDFFHPERIILGSSDQQAAHQVAELYLSLRAPIVVTDMRTAEMIKYASNAFLATKISFINEIARICTHVGADVKEVAAGMGYDKRIGRAFLDAGLGYGGSCFLKDVKALASIAEEAGVQPRLLHTIMETNHQQRRIVISMMTSHLDTLRDRTIGILGLAFKPDTDDMRDAPAIDIIRWLTLQEARVRVYDPVALHTARAALERKRVCLDKVTFCQMASEVAIEADAVVLVTEWSEFRLLDMAQMRASMRYPLFIDGRNFYDIAEMERSGFIYRGIGRGTGSIHTLSSLWKSIKTLDAAQQKKSSEESESVSPASA